MESKFTAIVIRYYAGHLLRTLDASDIISRAMARFPEVARIVFEPMSDTEKAEAAPVDRDGIACVEHRCFVYGQIGQELRRMQSLEEEIERSNP